MEERKSSIAKAAELLQKDIWQLAWKIGKNPEKGYKEYFASELLSNFLNSYRFNITKPLAGIDTSFLARFSRGLPGPKIAFLAEYDALPGIGHGCGHHLIGAASVGAAAVLSLIPELPGELFVVGCPAEETNGAKAALIEAGIFKEIDCAMMFHPGSCNVSEISSLALDAIEVSFFGKAAHMVVAKNNGVNALDALISLFQRVNKLKRKLAQDERIDGIIIHGGDAPNIVPDLAVARFYLRAGKREKLNVIRQKFLECAQKAADQVFARMSWHFFECSYDEMKSNRCF